MNRSPCQQGANTDARPTRRAGTDGFDGRPRHAFLDDRATAAHLQSNRRRPEAVQGGVSSAVLTWAATRPSRWTSASSAPRTATCSGWQRGGVSRRPALPHHTIHRPAALRQRREDILPLAKCLGATPPSTSNNRSRFRPGGGANEYPGRVTSASCSIPSKSRHHERRKDHRHHCCCGRLRPQ